jgi:hypothetical protein
MKIPNSDLEFLTAHPEDARWLKHHIDPGLWSKLEGYVSDHTSDGNVHKFSGQ